MKEHFLASGETHENKLRLTIFDIMRSFEKMYDVVDDLLLFEITKAEAQKSLEACLWHMESLNREMDLYVKFLEKEKLEAFHKTSLYEAVRRTYNFLTPLNYIDFEKENWVTISTKCFIDRIYYRQIKALVY